MLEVSRADTRNFKRHNEIGWESVEDLGDNMLEVREQTHQTFEDTRGWESVEDFDKMLEVSGADTPNFQRHKRVGKCRRLG